MRKKSHQMYCTGKRKCWECSRLWKTVKKCRLYSHRPKSRCLVYFDDFDNINYKINSDGVVLDVYK